MLNRKPLLIAAALAATVGGTTLSTQAHANDPLLGAVVGAGIGAAIGHGVQGRDGALVGGAIGAIAGAGIAANSSSYYDSGYYGAPPCTRPHRSTMGRRPCITNPRRWCMHDHGSAMGRVSATLATTGHVMSTTADRMTAVTATGMRTMAITDTELRP